MKTKILMIAVFMVLTVSLFAQVKPSNMSAATVAAFKAKLDIQTPAQADAKYVQKSDSIALSAITTIPTIYTAAGDTSSVPVPVKIGDIFIDTANSKVYVSKSAARNGWLKLN